MILRCKICKVPAKSLLIPQEKAMRECVDKIAKHVEEKHPSAMLAYVAEIQSLCRAVDAAMQGKRLIEIPEDEPYVLDIAQKGEDMLLDALGIDTNDVEPETSEAVPTLPEVPQS